MGIVMPGPPPELVLPLAKQYEINEFIETGTYYGKAATWAASSFQHVVTVEYSKKIYEANLANYGKIENVDFLFGDSRSALKEIVPQLKRPAIFWLDSHWSGAETYGEDDQCPLLEELQIIGESRHPNLIFIDDARLFTSPPPLPHSIKQWPSITEVLVALRAGGDDCYTVVIQDVIISVPEFAREFLADLCQEINTKEWQENSASLMKTWQEYGKPGDGSRESPHAANRWLGLRGIGIRSQLARMLARFRA
jgi:hypothetical protein